MQQNFFPMTLTYPLEVLFPIHSYQSPLLTEFWGLVSPNFDKLSARKRQLCLSFKNATKLFPNDFNLPSGTSLSFHKMPICVKALRFLCCKSLKKISKKECLPSLCNEENLESTDNDKFWLFKWIPSLSVLFLQKKDLSSLQPLCFPVQSKMTYPPDNCFLQLGKSSHFSNHQIITSNHKDVFIVQPQI
ncbi:hypothetical protein EGR_10513 [Echinococcus granulosus]|uniref:Uncharacterized protein n=1 Tax=Echinococcus granulosus TaxID=6210 RepID=W6U0J4_ECHGR|nr:hypothetical protein EGR_10513 [Echinococcus granulosus]EUB54640.1 hypothetical protein EGR_10513 [Echinococcus granulosus]